MGVRGFFALLFSFLLSVGAYAQPTSSQCPGVTPPFDYRSDLWTQHIKEQLPSTASIKAHPRLMLSPAVRDRIISDDRLAIRYLRNDLRPKADYYAKLITFSQLETWKSDKAKLDEMFSIGAKLAMAAWLLEEPRYMTGAITILDFVNANAQYLGKRTFTPNSIDLDKIEWGLRLNYLALMYDWTFPSLSQAQRVAVFSLILRELVNFANTAFILPESSRPWWFSGFYLYNWTMVIAGAVTNASLAILGDLSLFEPSMLPGSLISDVSTLRETLHSYIANSGGYLAKALSTYSPDGASPEGIMYWEISGTALFMALDSLRTALGTDFGLAKAPGLRETGVFYLSNRFHRFGDQLGRDGTSIISFLGRLLGDECYHERNSQLQQYAELYNFEAQQQVLGTVPGFYRPYLRPCQNASCPSEFTCKATTMGSMCVNALAANQFPYSNWESYRFKGWPTDFLNLLWLDPPRAQPSSNPWHRYIPRAKLYKGATKTWGDRSSLVEIAQLESDPFPMRVLLKGGATSAPHAHKDAGALWLKAGSTTWIDDVGAMSDDYALEGYHSSLSNDSISRWSYLRTDSLSHSALEIIAPDLTSISSGGLSGFYSSRIQQSADSNAPTILTIDPVRASASADLSKAYNLSGQTVSRTIRLINGASTQLAQPPSVEITDVVGGLDSSYALGFRMIQCGAFTHEINSKENSATITNSITGEQLDVRVTTPLSVAFEAFPLDPSYRLQSLVYPNLNPRIVKSALACKACGTSPCPTKCETPPPQCRVFRVRTTSNSAWNPATNSLRLALTLTPRVPIPVTPEPLPQAPKALIDIGAPLKKARNLRWIPRYGSGQRIAARCSHALSKKISRIFVVSPDRTTQISRLSRARTSHKRARYQSRLTSSMIPSGSYIVIILKNRSRRHVTISDSTREFLW